MKLDPTSISKLQPWFPNLDLGSISVVHDGPMCWYVRNVIKQGAMTISPFIFYGRDYLDPTEAWSVALLAHELKHVEQYRKMGHAGFLAAYLKDLAMAHFKYSSGLPLEAPAYALQSEVQSALRG